MRSLNDYELIKELGSGSFGKVYKARRRDNKIIALKVIYVPPDQDHLFQVTKLEVDNLIRLSNPGSEYVIKYYGSYYDERNRQILIEMELIDGIEMYDFVTNTGPTYIQNKEELYYYLLKLSVDITKGLMYSHSQGIIHNDIKLENIMVTLEGNKAKIIDYGLSCSAKVLDMWGQGCTVGGGTPYYIAPEYVQYGVRLPASDYWALGIMLYAAVIGKFPYIDDNVNILYNKISKQSPPRVQTNNDLINRLINGLLVKYPDQRLNGGQILSMLEDIPIPESLKNLDTGSFINIPSRVRMNTDSDNVSYPRMSQKDDDWRMSGWNESPRMSRQNDDWRMSESPRTSRQNDDWRMSEWNESPRMSRQNDDWRMSESPRMSRQNDDWRMSESPRMSRQNDDWRMSESPRMSRQNDDWRMSESPRMSRQNDDWNTRSNNFNDSNSWEFIDANKDINSDSFVIIDSSKRANPFSTEIRRTGTEVNKLNVEDIKRIKLLSDFFL
jgi:serine/threonine protein kinase